MLLVGKILFLLVATFFTFVNVGRVIMRQYVSPINLILQAIGYVGFITLQWLI